VDDEAWLDRARAGDAAAFDRLVTRHERALYALARALSPTADDALDACQEAAIRAWRAIGRFDGPAANVAPWLARIVRNCCLDRGRALRRIAVRLDGLPNAAGDASEVRSGAIRLDPERDPEALALAAETAAAVERAVAELPAEQRATLALARAGFAYEEIAEALGIAEGTVKSRIARARAALRLALTGLPIVEPPAAEARSNRRT